MNFLKWVGSLIASTIGVFLILGAGGFFFLFGGAIVSVVILLAIVVFGAHAIMEYLEDR